MLSILAIIDFGECDFICDGALQSRERSPPSRLASFRAAKVLNCTNARGEEGGKSFACSYCSVACAFNGWAVGV